MNEFLERSLTEAGLKPDTDFAIDRYTQNLLPLTEAAMDHIQALFPQMTFGSALAVHTKEGWHAIASLTDAPKSEEFADAEVEAMIRSCREEFS